MLKSLRYKILIKEHKSRIYSYSCYMLKNRLDADDVTQEVLIRIWNNLDNFELSSAKSWIMKTTHNLCLDYLRRRKVNSEREYVIGEGEEMQVKAPHYFSDPEISTRREMLKERIATAIERLPELLKEIFVMYEIQGFKYKEISETINVPLNSVKVYLLRARKKMQEELKEFKNETTEYN